jgi:FtsH-binding integral membrane protein
MMQFRVRKMAHVLERFGLALAGAACGLFVAAYVGSSVAAFASQAFLVIMMIGGAIGFYLGIDTPPLAFHGLSAEASKGASGGKIDTAEFLSAAGTFLATLTAFVSVGVIVLREDPHIFWTVAVMLGWVVGLTMQIIAGAIARTRA